MKNLRIPKNIEETTKSALVTLSKEGYIVDTYSSFTSPLSKNLINGIEKLL